MYKKVIDGKTIVKDRSQIVIIKDGLQTISPSEEMVLADGWEKIIPVEPVETLEIAQERKIQEILEYDSSKQVNIFKVNGIDMWLDKATRTGLMLRFHSEQSAGKTETTLWYDGIPTTLTIEQAIQLLYSLELYASACYDNTQRHIANVKSIETIEAVNSYDYMEGYPEIITLNL